MGVRLYIKSSLSEEEITGVPKGTSALLDAFEVKGNDGSMTEDAWHDELQRDKDMSLLFNYRVFGFGKLTRGVFVYLESRGFDIDSGSTTDPEHIISLVGIQKYEKGDSYTELLKRVKFEQIKEVSWY